MYVVQSRAKGKSVRVTVGRHGVISADEARRRAARIVNRIKAGEEPVAEPLPARLAGGPTVADLAARYMEEHVAVHCKASTAEGFQGLLDKYIVPEFGRLPLLAVERERVVAFHARLSGVPYAANRAVAVLSRMYRMATSRGMVPDGTNPCRGVRKFPTRPRERFLTDTEFRRLGTVLDRAVADGGVSVHAVAAIRLLLLTGLPQERDPVASDGRTWTWRRASSVLRIARPVRARFRCRRRRSGCWRSCRALRTAPGLSPDRNPART